MTDRIATIMQIMEQLGAPLIAVADGGASSDDPQTATKMAELLSRSVQLSISLTAFMDIKDGGPSDSIRLALAALAAQLVSGHYRETGKTPGDAEEKRFVAAMGAVLTFADNFTQAAENAVRLETLTAGSLPIDEHQVVMQYMDALIPVINVVAAFPFGQQETKLIQEVTARLVETASVLRRDMMASETSNAAIHRSELTFLKALATLYIECHRAETARLMALSEEERLAASQDGGGALSMDPVWEAFETRVSMLEVLGDAVLPQSVTGDRAPGAMSTSPPPVAEQPSEPPAVPEAAQTAPVQQGVASEEKTGESYNPMAFFTPGDKDSDGDNA